MMNLVNNFSKLFPRCLTTGLYLWSLYAIVVCIHVIRARVVLPLVFTIAMVALYTYAKLIYVGPGTTKEYSILRVYDLNAAESGFELPPEMLVKEVIHKREMVDLGFVRAVVVGNRIDAITVQLVMYVF